MTGDRWTASGQLAFQMHKNGGVLEIDVPASASPFVVVQLEFERCRVLAFKSINSLLGRDFRSAAIRVTDLCLS